MMMMMMLYTSMRQCYFHTLNGSRKKVSMKSHGRNRVAVLINA